jgi:hypothetical protein
MLLHRGRLAARSAILPASTQKAGMYNQELKLPRVRPFYTKRAIREIEEKAGYGMLRDIRLPLIL